MTCPVCGHLIPDKMLVCPRCAEERSRLGMRQYQHHAVRLIADGRGVFTTRVINNVRHVQMIGCERTFCYEKIESGHRRGTQSFESLHDSATFICSKCRDVIGAILREAQECSA